MWGLIDRRSPFASRFSGSRANCALRAIPERMLSDTATEMGAVTGPKMKAVVVYCGRSGWTKRSFLLAPNVKKGPSERHCGHQSNTTGWKIWIRVNHAVVMFRNFPQSLFSLLLKVVTHSFGVLLFSDYEAQPWHYDR